MNSTDLVKLTQDIVRLRTSKHITQADVAKAVGVTVSTLSRWENNGFRSTKLIDLIKVIEYLEFKGAIEVKRVLKGSNHGN